MTRSNFDLSRTVVDYLEQSKPSQTIWEQQNYQTPPGNIWDHLKPFRNISDQLKQYLSISDQLWQSLTISDHLATSQTISDQVCPSMTISAHLGPSHFRPHLKPSLNIGPSLTICSPFATNLWLSRTIRDYLGPYHFSWDQLTTAKISLTFCGSRSCDNSDSIWVLYHFHIGCKNCIRLCSYSISFHVY